MGKMDYLIGDFSKITGLGIHTLRYYEKEGLITPRRDSTGRRLYGDGDIAWIEFIVRLKETGMPLRDIRKYAQMRYAGDSTMPARLKMLEGHRAFICGEIKKWEEHLDKMDKKIKIYKEQIARMR